MRYALRRIWLQKRAVTVIRGSGGWAAAARKHGMGAERGQLPTHASKGIEG